MQTEKLRWLFANFLKEHGLTETLRVDSCLTIDQDVTLKYERIDKYRVIILDSKEIKKLLAFCIKHDISVWFGADKLCIGFNYKGNMRLSAYSSVPHGAGYSELATDIIPSVLPEKICSGDIADRNTSEVV